MSITRISSELTSLVAGPVARLLTRRHARILMYHRFAPPGADPRATSTEDLERQLRFIAKHLRPSRLTDIVQALRAGEPLEPLSVVITVDDGYHDFFEHAYPLLQKYGIPATVYVVSEFLDGSRWLWFDAIQWLVENASPMAHQVVPTDPQMSLSLSSPAGRRQAWVDIATRFSRLAPEEQSRDLLILQNVLDVALPAKPTARFSAMTWEQAARLDPELIEVGGHTCTHPILSRCSPARQQWEVENCKKSIEAKIDRQVRSFCYPNGLRDDFTDITKGLVLQSGFESAVSAYGGFQSAGADLYSLNRVGAPDSMRMFRNCVNGVWHVRDSLR